MDSESVEALAEKARKKELHRKSMIWTGALIALAASAAGWIGFAPERLVPRFSRSKGEAVALKPMLARWEGFSLHEERPTLLLMTAAWSRPCRETDGTTFADPDVARMLAEEFHAARADADERPDLALRYLTRYPTVAILLPTGQIVDSGPYAYHPKAFLGWARTVAAKAKEKRAAVEEAAAKALAKAGEEAPAALSRRAVLAGLQERTRGFARFDRLAALRGLGADAAAARAEKAALSLEHEAGGIRRDESSEERLLGDQAAALASLKDPAALGRVRTFVEEALALPSGGYAFGLDYEGRRDERVFCDENGRMAAALGRAAEPCWRARKGGVVPRRLGGKVYGLLGDQLGVLESLLAAGRAADAKALAAAVERTLLDEKGEAFYDRPARGELAAPLDRLRVPALNARAWRLWKRLGSPRAPALEQWLRRRSSQLDAADLADLAER
jgi:hypothetical protein